jgi:hypothetical protein
MSVLIGIEPISRKPNFYEGNISSRRQKNLSSDLFRRDVRARESLCCGNDGREAAQDNLGWIISSRLELCIIILSSFDHQFTSPTLNCTRKVGARSFASPVSLTF